MLSYLPSFCNAFPAHPTPARGGPAARRPLCRCRLLLAAVARRRRRLAGAADLQRSQPDACGTHTPQSALQPHVTCPSSPRPSSMACLWWTPPRVSLLEHQTCPRRRSVQACARVLASPHAPACAAVIMRASRGMRQAFRHTSWSRGCVPTGDAPRTYGRPGCVPTGDAPRTYGRRFSLEALPPQTLRPSRL